MFRLHVHGALLLSLLGMFLPCIAQAGEKYALLIGVRKYTKAHLRSLLYTEADIVGISAALQDAGYRSENVVLMSQTEGVNDKSHMPLHANIRKELRSLLKGRDSTDTVLIAFAGHGIQFKGNPEPYFLPMDADLHDKTTLISLDEVYQQIQQCKAQLRLLIVDACRDDPQLDQSRALPERDRERWLVRQDSLSLREAGPLFYCAAPQKDEPFNIPKLDLETVTRPQAKVPPRGVAALFSCSESQKAYESVQLKHSVFFHFLIDGLRGKADLKKDSNITLAELADYTATQVKRFVNDEYHEQQDPILRGETPAGFVVVTLGGDKPVGLGISDQIVMPRLARRLGLPRKTGVQIQGVLPGLSAAKSGLRRGDVILKINDTEIANDDMIDSALARFKPGDSAEAEVLRSGKRVRMKLELQARLSRAEFAQRLLQEAKRGEAWAQYELSLLYATGDGVSLDTSEASNWCRQAAKNGLAQAQTILGYMYKMGDWDIKQDEKEAAKWYLRAAEQGDSNAQLNLGEMYRQGQGVRQDDGEAFKWYSLAAQDELPLAQNDLGNMYHLGRGVARDDQEAFNWYRKAAEQGLPTAQKNLGLMYRLGSGVARDDKAAVKWYRKAAEQGDLIAEYNLGNLYLKGWGVEKDEREALKCYRQAAEKELPDAQVALALMYLYGRGVDKDPREAFKWAYQAANNGLPLAQRYVGQMYHIGSGVKKDLNEALRWYRLAAKNGDKDAQRLLERLEP